MRRVVIALALFVASIATYIVAANIMLERALDHLSNDGVAFSTAYTLLPGHIHVENLVFRARDQQRTIVVGAERVDARLDLWTASSSLRLTSVTADGVRIALVDPELSPGTPPTPEMGPLQIDALELRRLVAVRSGALAYRGSGTIVARDVKLASASTAEGVSVQLPFGELELANHPMAVNGGRVEIARRPRAVVSAAPVAESDWSVVVDAAVVGLLPGASRVVVSSHSLFSADLLTMDASLKAPRARVRVGNGSHPFSVSIDVDGSVATSGPLELRPHVVARAPGLTIWVDADGTLDPLAVRFIGDASFRASSASELLPMIGKAVLRIEPDDLALDNVLAKTRLQ